MKRFDGKCAIVTGAAGGIGRAITARLAHEGARVLAVDILATELGETARAAKAEALVCDVTNEGAPERIMSNCLDRFGALDFLVNNAGVGGARAAADTTDGDWDRYFDVDLKSVFRLSRQALPIITAPGGRIVNITSVFGLVGFPGSCAYSVAKAGVAQLTRQMAADYTRRGILVNAIAPGVIRTRLTEERIDHDPWYRRAMVETTPIDRVGEPDDIAGVVAFLCSDDASFIAGEVVTVDGGWAATRYSPPP